VDVCLFLFFLIVVAVATAPEVEVDGVVPDDGAETAAVIVAGDIATMGAGEAEEAAVDIVVGGVVVRLVGTLLSEGAAGE